MDNTAFVKEVIDLTNEFRAKNGLDPLSVDVDLTEAAQKHSASMAKQDFFSHTGPNGSKPKDRAKSAGYETQSVGENIAAGYRTPQDVVDGWIASSGHRRNMLNSKYNEIGVGYYYERNDKGDVNYRHYWTQVFGNGDIEDPAPQNEPSTPDVDLASPKIEIPVSNNTPSFSPSGPSASAIDPLQYGASHADLIAAFGDDPEALLNHYVTAGQFEERSLDLFDEVSYLASHDDLLNAFGSDFTAATKHYIQHGYFEGRSLDSFDEARYIASHADLIKAFGDDLQAGTLHYVTHGALEQRSTTTFDPVGYLNNYDDLRQAFGNDLDAATRHYIDHGYSEGRTWV